MDGAIHPAMFFRVEAVDIGLWVAALLILGLIVSRRKSRKSSG